MGEYSAVYDAVRSRVEHCATEEVLREAIVNNWNIAEAASAFVEAAGAMTCEANRPSVLYRPRLSKDGNAWIACLGDNLQIGVVGCGDTPEDAMRDFDRVWYLTGN